MSELITMDKRDLIKAFRDYQKEWLYSHHDFELSPMLEEVFAKFLDDTAERFMVEKAQLSEEDATKDATSVCKCPCEYREPCDYCHYDAYREHGCPAEEGLKDE